MAGGPLNGTEQYVNGRPCPKCGYVRTAESRSPAWQCPGCGIAYAKFGAPAPLAMHVALTGGLMKEKATEGRSIRALLAANLVAAAIALASGARLHEMMLVYWTQSVIIGLTHFVRIASLRDFSTEGFRMNDRVIEPLSENKWRVAVFFLLHYGFFHFGYLMMFWIGEPRGPALQGPLFGATVALCALVFAANHIYSLLHNIEADRAGRPNIGTMMMMPYVRIVPMHLTIIAGGLLFVGLKATLLFIALKIAADLLMHLFEHSLLQAGPLLHRLD
jgi:ribosomal protein L37AE/L43A